MNQRSLLYPVAHAHFGTIDCGIHIGSNARRIFKSCTPGRVQVCHASIILIILVYIHHWGNITTGNAISVMRASVAFLTLKSAGTTENHKCPQNAMCVHWTSTECYGHPAHIRSSLYRLWSKRCAKESAFDSITGARAVFYSQEQHGQNYGVHCTTGVQ